MTENNDLEGGPRPMLISREDMEEHIRAGRALRWAHPVAGRTFMAARLDGTWFVVLQGMDDYQQAPDELATGLTTWQEQLDRADQMMAEVTERESRRDATPVDVNDRAQTS
jgi:hypothetical protein